MLRWGRQKIGLAGQSIKPAPAANDVECSTQPAIVHQLRLPCHPEHFEIHSEDEETHTPRSTNADQDGTELRTPDSCCVSVELEDAYARIRTLESELHQQKQMSTALREESVWDCFSKMTLGDAHQRGAGRCPCRPASRASSVPKGAAGMPRRSESDEALPTLCFSCAFVNLAFFFRVQLDALSELGSEKVPCTDCLSVFADWLKASLKDMAVQELHAKRAIHDSNHKQELRRQLDGLKIGRKQSSRWAPPSTSERNVFESAVPLRKEKAVLQEVLALDRGGRDNILVPQPPREAPTHSGRRRRPHEEVGWSLGVEADGVMGSQEQSDSPAAPPVPKVTPPKHGGRAPPRPPRVSMASEPTDAQGLIAVEAAEAAEAANRFDADGTATPETPGAVQAPVLHMACAMCMFASLLCLMTIVSIGLLVYLAYQYTKHSTDNCDVPLQLWVQAAALFGPRFQPNLAPALQVVSLTALFNLACNQQDRYGTLGARTGIFCGWSFDPENPERMPMRVQAYNLLVPIFTALRNCVGLYWVSQAKEPGKDAHKGVSGIVSVSEEGEFRPCSEVAPGLLSAVHAYASFNLTYSFFILLGVAGLSQILFWLARRGLIRVSDAAPPGSLERNTEEVGLDDPALLEQPNCSICLEDLH
eukprot:g23457.t1